MSCARDVMLVTCARDVILVTSARDVILVKYSRHKEVETIDSKDSESEMQDLGKAGQTDSKKGGTAPR